MTENDTNAEFLAANQANWDERATLHAARSGSGYATGQFVADRERLSEVVRFDLPLLGDITGSRAVHLQCHIGTDTLSLARLGARVTGLDFSERAIDEAQKLVAETSDAVEFVRADVMAAPELLSVGSFDLVYTGIGALCWLPRIRDWAAVVAALLAPGGTLFLREGHPILWAMDETITDEPHLRFPYFERVEPLAWDDDQSYVPTTESLTATRSYEWNHGIGEIVTALIDAGLRIELLVEHDSVPWEALPGQMALRENGEWARVNRPESMPLSYTLRASKPA